jgi:hypothetical protein
MSDYIQISVIKGHQNLHYIPTAATIGNIEVIKSNMSKDDFYTLCMKNTDKNIGLRKKSNKKQHHLPTFKSSDTSIDYLCSDLVRFCLCLQKNQGHINLGEMSLIPKEPIPISQELKEYIEEFLPDYYGIRDNVK